MSTEAKETKNNQRPKDKSSGNVHDTFLQCKRDAQSRDPKAMLKLANMYYHGRDSDGCCIVRMDHALAKKWYRRAALLSQPEAQRCLGLMYSDVSDTSVRLDLEKAVYWLREAAKQGDLVAEFSLGQCYEFGEGVETDFEKAFQWYSRSAKQGFKHALNVLKDDMWESFRSKGKRRKDNEVRSISEQCTRQGEQNAVEGKQNGIRYIKDQSSTANLSKSRASNSVKAKSKKTHEEKSPSRQDENSSRRSKGKSSISRGLQKKSSRGKRTKASRVSHTIRPPSKLSGSHRHEMWSDPKGNDGLEI